MKKSMCTCGLVPLNALCTTVATLALGLLKFHNLTTFHVFIFTFFFIVFLLMYIERNERTYRDSTTPHSKGGGRHRFFVQRANVLSVGVVWFYLVYGAVAQDVYFTANSVILTNVLSACFVLIALGASLHRKRFKSGTQEKIMVIYVLLLCFPVNLLQKAAEILVALRIFVFFLVFNLELYVGKMLRYRTTYKQLVLCSYFAFSANVWFLIAAIPIVLTHFLEIHRRAGRFKSRGKPGEFPPEYSSSDFESDTETESSSNSGTETEVENGHLFARPNHNLSKNVAIEVPYDSERIKLLLARKRQDELK